MVADWVCARNATGHPCAMWCQDGRRPDTNDPGEDAMVTTGLWVPLKAKPGKEAEVEAFLDGR